MRQAEARSEVLAAARAILFYIEYQNSSSSGGRKRWSGEVTPGRW
jgi:hypothetical protein